MLHKTTLIAGMSALLTAAAYAQNHPAFEKRFEEIRSRPEFRHSRFGVEVYSVEEERVLYQWNGQE
ncbi:MAG: hypothetical protein JO022_09470, partial [Acidobacteriaceae bacterium]|nr:hypothetical protein [Acidobacteriaceae bacterium]